MQGTLQASKNGAPGFARSVSEKRTRAFLPRMPAKAGMAFATARTARIISASAIWASARHSAVRPADGRPRTVSPSPGLMPRVRVRMEPPILSRVFSSSKAAVLMNVRSSNIDSRRLRSRALSFVKPLTMWRPRENARTITRSRSVIASSTNRSPDFRAVLRAAIFMWPMSKKRMKCRGETPPPAGGASPGCSEAGTPVPGCAQCSSTASMGERTLSTSRSNSAAPKPPRAFPFLSATTASRRIEVTSIRPGSTGMRWTWPAAGSSTNPPRPTSVTIRAIRAAALG